jgi:hypothetical protein
MPKLLNAVHPDNLQTLAKLGKRALASNFQRWKMSIYIKHTVV